MRTLIAVTTCHARRDQADAQRQTWVKGLDNVKFFIGRPDGTCEQDEVTLDVDDSYAGLPAKVKAMCRWALNTGYDAVLKLDDDVYLVPERLKRSGIERYEYAGNFRSQNGNYPAHYASGFCYWLAGRALETVAEAKLTADTMEDRWVGNVLFPDYARLRLCDEKRFSCTSPGIDEASFLWGSPIGKTNIAFAQYPAKEFEKLHYWYRRCHVDTVQS